MNDNPMSQLEKDELIEYAKALIVGALTRLDSGSYPGAVTRLANALGALSFVVERPSPGIDSFTTLGFRLTMASQEEK